MRDYVANLADKSAMELNIEGFNLASNGKYLKSIYYFEAALAKNDILCNFKASYNLGSAYRLMGNHEVAVEWYLEAVKLCPILIRNIVRFTKQYLDNGDIRGFRFYYSSCLGNAEQLMPAISKYCDREIIKQLSKAYCDKRYELNTSRSMGREM